MEQLRIAERGERIGQPIDDVTRCADSRSVIRELACHALCDTGNARVSHHLVRSMLYIRVLAGRMGGEDGAGGGL